jgi:hypothetical protein
MRTEKGEVLHWQQRAYQVLFTIVAPHVLYTKKGFSLTYF